MRPEPPPDEFPGDPEVPFMAIEITSPLDGDTLTGPQNGTPITVSGTVYLQNVSLEQVTVQIGQITGQATIGADQPDTWSYTGSANAPGVVKTIVTAKGKTETNPRYAKTARHEITVNIPDTVPPHKVSVEGAILSPSNVQEIFAWEPGSTVPLTIYAHDHLGVRRVEWRPDGSAAYTAMIHDVSEGARWKESVPLPSWPLSKYTIYLRATDLAGNTTPELTVNFVDKTAPAYEIIEPKENAKILGTGVGARVKLMGTARDLHSRINSVEWSLDGVQFVQATTTDNWAHWSAEVSVGYGFQSISFRFTDQAGNQTSSLRNVEVLSSYKPKDIEELLSPRAYLDALLEFARDHVDITPGDQRLVPLSTEILEQVFHQPFGKLKEPLSELGNQPVNRLRICIEVLRKYLPSQPKALVGHWKFDEESGVTASDSSEKNNDGTLQGPTWVAGRFGTALSFGGVDDYVQIGDRESLKMTNTMSISAWIYPKGPGSTEQGGIVVNKEGEYEIARFADGTIRWAFANSDPSWNWFNTGYVAQLDQWNHIAVVYDDGIVKTYANGELVHTYDGKGPIGDINTAQNDFRIGGRQELSHHFHGIIDDMRIYDLALSQKSVQSLANGIPGDDLAATEYNYRLAAYQTSLVRLGTSYEEIRLARGATSELRKALVERLGITLRPTRPDELDELFAQPSTLTEKWLEEMFGLADTERDLLDPPPPRPKLLDWQESRLKELWMYQDHPAQPGTDSQPPIIDPDLIDEEDLVPGSHTAYNLWKTRDIWVRSEYATLKQSRESQPTPLDGFNKIINDVLGQGTDLTALEAELKTGKSIEASLKSLHLTMHTFTYLLRIRALVQAGTVTDMEWADVYNILTQVRKNQELQTWRTQEQLITLTPEYFRISRNKKRPPPWRASNQARREWQEQLQARIDQKQALEDVLQASVSAVEETALPMLRDGLVASLGGPQLTDQVSDQLTKRLLIDIKASGSQTTTRILQAIETLQGVIFSLRTGQFEEGHPADKWDPVEGEEESAGNKEENFDKEWKWMGSYATWRAAMLVFLYPENILLPSLREENDQTEHFKTLISNLRNNPRLTPGKARKEAKQYLDSLRSSLPITQPQYLWLRAFTLTDQLSEQELIARGELVKNQWASFSGLLKELCYLVPMQLALQLQKSGEHVAALDWYQTIYAYNLPLEKRKIYYGLELEQNIAPTLQEDPHWLRKWLNPHTIAATRPNPYTRYTLMSLVRCLLEFADSDFTRDTGESIAKARTLYLTAQDLLALPELEPRIPTNPNQVLLPNPVLESLRLRVETQLLKLRQGRNIAGMKRQIELPVPLKTITGLPTVGRGGQLVIPGAQPALQPTPYRYSVLMERSKLLVNIAQQIEAAYLAALEKRDVANYDLKRAGFDLDLAEAEKNLQGLRVVEAQKGEQLAALQQDLAEIQRDTYGAWIDAGLNEYEQRMLREYEIIKANRDWIAGFDMAQTLAQAAMSGAQFTTPWQLIVNGIAVGQIQTAAVGRFISSMEVNSAEERLQKASFYASHERRKQEWQLQKSLAVKNVEIGAQQILIAQDHTNVVKQEKVISDTKSVQAKAMVDFLANKFTNADLYEWMSGVLAGVYSYFLQQATAMAKLAENQLAFERQQTASIIQADYWVLPTETGTFATQEAKDRRGLTGSARLLQDIYQLDQFAFESDKRRLNLTQTFSLARLAPFEFQIFREAGVLRFATPMELFDQGFPGHYLRLIKRVRTSVVALIPPTQGIRATLTASGISRVINKAEDVFQETMVRRDPEMVALTSPINATGVFELDVQSEMLLPFESMGVDTAWEFQMPKAANQFDFNTIADVLVTIECTALNDFNYRKQVIQNLNPDISAERPFSFRQQYADQWYDLHNPDQTDTPLVVKFSTRREDFPPNLDGLKIQQVLLYFARKFARKEDSFEIPVTYLLFTEQNVTETVGGEATTIDGVISTRRGNGSNWKPMIGKSPFGDWQLSLKSDDRVKDKEIRDRFKNEEIEDILFVITYSGRTPEWPN